MPERSSCAALVRASRVRPAHLPRSAAARSRRIRPADVLGRAGPRARSSRPVRRPTFEAGDAARTARAIVAARARSPARLGGRPRRPPTSSRERFAAIEGGEVSEQDFDAEFDGDGRRASQNVLLTLPGRLGAERPGRSPPATRPRARAPRRAPRRPATLLALAENLGGPRHERRSSSPRPPAAATGPGRARAHRGAARPRDRSTARRHLTARAYAVPSAAHVIPRGPTRERLPAARRRPPAYDRRRASSAARARARARAAGSPRLAVPIGLGEQAALRRAGLEAIAISAGGERARSPATRTARIDLDRVARRSRAGTTLDLLLTLDEAERAAGPGPDDYVRLGDNLIPGWSLSLLAIALLLPPLLAAADTWLREQRARLAHAADAVLGGSSAPWSRSPRCCSPTCSGCRARPRPALPLRPRPLPAGRGGARSPSSPSPPPSPSPPC